MGERIHGEDRGAARTARDSVPAGVTIGALADGDLRALRDRFLGDPRRTDLSMLRPVIERSWRRSQLWEVDAGSRVFPASREPQLDELLMRCAGPIIADLERIANDQGAAVCLADPAGTIVAFRGDPSTVRAADRAFPIVGGAMTEAAVGTNAEGTALEEGVTVQTWGAEHFADGMHGFCCTSVPIKDPLRRTVRAFVSLALPRRLGASVDPRSVALIVEGAAAELTRLLAERLAVREQALLTAYLAETRKRGADAVVVLDERTTIASKGALALLQQSDFAVLAAYAREAEQLGKPVAREIAIASERVVRLDVRPIEWGGGTAGSIARLHPIEAAATAAARSTQARTDPFSDLVGESLALRRTLDVAATAVTRRLPAVVIGERGTGKRSLARAMASARTGEAEVVDCSGGGAAVDATRDLLARDAAVVLAGVDGLADAALASLLDLVRDVDAPPIVLTAGAMSNALLAVVAALRGVEVEVPPLRKRREDVRLLAARFLADAAPGGGPIAPSLLRALTEADWPGNVAQLRQVIESAAARAGGGELRLEHVGEAHRRALARSPLGRLEEAELAQIRDALAEATGNRARAAEILQIGRSTLYRKLETYARRGFDVG